MDHLRPGAPLLGTMDQYLADMQTAEAFEAQAELPTMDRWYRLFPYVLFNGMLETPVFRVDHIPSDWTLHVHCWQSDSLLWRIKMGEVLTGQMFTSGMSGFTLSLPNNGAQEYQLIELVGTYTVAGIWVIASKGYDPRRFVW